MSLKKAQKIQSAIDDATGIDIASFQNSDLYFLKDKIEQFLDLGIETEDLVPADGDETNYRLLDDVEDVEEEEDYA